MELSNHGEGLLQFRYRHGGQNIPLRSCARRAALGGCLAMAGEGVFPPLLAVSALLAASPARAGEGGVLDSMAACCGFARQRRQPEWAPSCSPSAPARSANADCGPMLGQGVVSQDWPSFLS